MHLTYQFIATIPQTCTAVSLFSQVNLAVLGTTTVPATTQPQLTPILTREIFGSSNPTPPAPKLTTAPPTIFQPRHSTRNNFGQPHVVLYLSIYFITQHYHILVPTTTSQIEHYCNTLGIRQLSGTYGCTTSQGGSKRILYTPKQTESDRYAKI